jgi:hypothetical protein
MHVIEMEYPGYGIYRSEEANADTIIQNSEIVYNYLLNDMHIKQEDIIVFGRSMGSGPATHLAS